MTMNPKALILDDEADILELISLTLLRMGIDCTCCQTIAEATAQLKQNEFQFCLTDLRLPDGDGLNFVRTIQQSTPNLPCAVITAHGSMDLAIEALKAGAFDFVSKPIELNKLRDLVQTAIELQSSSDASQVEKTTSEQLLVGKSEAINKVRATAQKLARSMAPVFISGASGTGKELVARSIHMLGPRQKQPFIAVNCGAIPSELMESEFFGHRKGAFTGAIADKQGLFAAASGGTLFLDEVADLPLAMQVKLLRALQEKSVRPVGASEEVAVDVRVLTATHKDLEKLVEQGDFRQDLFYRINVIGIHVPKLSERPEDIPLIAKHILEKLSHRYELSALQLSDNAIEALIRYSFPGNVRELENILERAVTMADRDILEADDLNLFNKSKSDCLSNKPTLAHLSGGSLDDYLLSIEGELIQQALKATNGNKTQAAEKLGISFRAFRYKLQKQQMSHD